MHRLIDANMPYIILGCFGASMSARAVARMRLQYNFDATGRFNVHHLRFGGSNTKSYTTLNNQMANRGWTKDSVRNTVRNPYTTRRTTNVATGNPATVYYKRNGAYVIVDDITLQVIQVSDTFDPVNWISDPNIIDPFIP